ncbi:hypothetical protein T11_13977 [Trichinella zimbabwensis]|uniref:Uncharacterized protein n=1 Tax=Trichinella zimbabwensis TaxID=268475 RepID=A0A0V1G7V2_9BILA|nr:hypothetical protein T11_13977 [Trichinella zimbabwensis]
MTKATMVDPNKECHSGTSSMTKATMIPVPLP